MFLGGERGATANGLLVQTTEHKVKLKNIRGTDGECLHCSKEYRHRLCIQKHHPAFRGGHVVVHPRLLVLDLDPQELNHFPDERNTVGSCMVGEPFVKVKVLPSGCESRNIKGKGKRLHFQKCFQNLERWIRCQIL